MGDVNNGNDQRQLEIREAANQNNAADVNAERPERQQSRFEMIFSVAKSLIVRGLIIYFISTFFRRSTTPNVDQSNENKIGAVNLFENGTIFDMFIFLSEDDNMVNFNNPSSLIWAETELHYGDWSSGYDDNGAYTKTVEFAPSQNVRNNGSIYLHAYLIKHNPYRQSSNISDLVTRPEVIHTSKRLNKYKKRSFVKTQNLLTGETSASPEDVLKAELAVSEVVSHWHPNVTINVVTDQSVWYHGSVPAPINEYIEFIPGSGTYKPIVFFNDFWNMRRDYQPINDTVEKLRLHLTYQPISMFKWQIYLAQASRSKWGMQFYGGDSNADVEEEDQDSLKEMLLETSPYLIGLTVIVSLLHSVFELLAFKNDIQFWNNRESLEGLSVRSVFFNVFQSVIVFLYVLDNDGNMMITISCFIGLMIEVWKIKKVVDVTLDRTNKIFGIFPKIIIKDKGSYVKSSTRQYDELAFKYLSWLLFPLLAGYAIYSLIYQEHKGWYSWVLNMLYGFLLTFGFIMMTPQLFINYKLKSVAHLPWRMMSYKCLNTFIDDIFAFVIKMPTLYRLGCLRDDIVFFIFLYQRWIYKIDPSRLNEFGYSAEMENRVRLQRETEQQPSIEQNPSSTDAAINEPSAKTSVDKKQD